MVNMAVQLDLFLGRPMEITGGVTSTNVGDEGWGLVSLGPVYRRGGVSRWGGTDVGAATCRGIVLDYLLISLPNVGQGGELVGCPHVGCSFGGQCVGLCRCGSRGSAGFSELCLT